jgi:hypothetical protein
VAFCGFLWLFVAFCGFLWCFTQVIILATCSDCKTSNSFNCGR